MESNNANYERIRFYIPVLLLGEPGSFLQFILILHPCATVHLCLHHTSNCSSVISDVNVVVDSRSRSCSFVITTSIRDLNATKHCQQC